MTNFKEGEYNFFSIFKGNCMLPKRKWAQKQNIKKGK
jgi:hypothetical protein